MKTVSNLVFADNNGVRQLNISAIGSSSKVLVGNDGPGAGTITSPKNTSVVPASANSNQAVLGSGTGKDIVNAISASGSGLPTEKAVADYIAQVLSERACDYREWSGSVNTGTFSAALGTLWTNRAKYSMIIGMSTDMDNMCISSAYTGDYSASATNYFSNIAWFILFPNVQNITGNGSSSSYGGPKGQLLIGAQAYNKTDWSTVHNTYNSDSRLSGYTHANGIRIYVGESTHIGAISASRYHTFIGVLK